MAHIILSIVLAVLFVGTGTPKIVGLPFSIKGRNALRLPAWFWRLTGSLEVLGAIGLIVGIWVVPLGIAAASALTLFMIAAALARIRGIRLAQRPISRVAKGVTLDAVLAVVLIVDIVLLALGI